MLEVFTEIRIKDYIIIGLILISLFLMWNLPSFISHKLPKVNPSEYKVELLGRIIEATPIHKKSETYAGSRLGKTGYKVELKYVYFDTININKTIFVNYNSYDVNRQVIDEMLNSEDKNLPIRIKENNPEEVILNTIAVN